MVERSKKLQKQATFLSPGKETSKLVEAL